MWGLLYTAWHCLPDRALLEFMVCVLPELQELFDFIHSCSLRRVAFVS